MLGGCSSLVLASGCLWLAGRGVGWYMTGSYVSSSFLDAQILIYNVMVE